jgi:Ca2+/Na+ antiporter
MPRFATGIAPLCHAGKLEKGTSRRYLHIMLSQKKILSAKKHFSPLQKLMLLLFLLLLFILLWLLVGSVKKSHHIKEQINRELLTA